VVLGSVWFERRKKYDCPYYPILFGDAPMGALTVEIDQLVNSLGKIRFHQPIIECITNSLEANSNNMIVELFSACKEGTAYSDDRFVNKVVIKDDGEGFSESNFKAFKEYRTKKKIHLGCRGVGRLTWLKIFKKAEIQSVLREDGKILKKVFIFDEDFDYSSEQTISEMPSNTKAMETSVTLFELKDESNSIPENVEKIRDVVFIELLPKLLLLNRNFSITFKSEHPEIKIQRITSSDLPKLEEEKFDIQINSQKQTFILRYNLYDGESDKTVKHKTHAYYCANKRAVETFESKGLTVNLSLDDKQYGIFLLESKLFDDRVNDSRNKIVIEDGWLFDGKLSWDYINESLRPILTKIIYKKWPKLKEEAEKDKVSLAEENPHLTSYIKKFNVVGRLHKPEALQKAEKDFEHAKKRVRQKYKDLLGRHKIKDENIQAFQQLAANTTEIGKQELAEYIWYRKVVIDVMEKLLATNERQEKVIHNLIMPMKTTDKERTEDNNLWLLDDKFSLYQYAASDLEIKEIYKDVCGEDIPEGENKDEKDRPDLCIFFSDSQKSSDDLEAVIIELKAFTADKYDKSKGLDQLPLYAHSFRKRHTKFKKFWVYLIVDEIDDEFRRLLTVSRNWKRFFCHNGEVYLQYNEEISAYLSVLTASALTANAKARNHKFLEIVQSSVLDKHETSV